MATYAQTTVKRTVTGNRKCRIYTLANVQTTGSKLITGLRKITTYHPETSSPATSQITVVTNLLGDLTFAADSESQGRIVVWGW